MNTTRQQTFMQLALQEAEKAAARDEVPIGAVLVQGDEVLAADGNRTRELNDVSAHAEVLVIRRAGELLQAPRLTECELFVTLEPCPMCAQAISFARLHTIHFAALDPKGGGVLHGPRIFEQPTCFHRPKVEHGLLAKPCGDILRQFFQARRGT